MTRGPRARRLPAALLAAAGALALGGCTGSAANSQGMADRPYLEAHPGERTANLLLLADAPVGPGQLNFDGASAGRMTVTVPVGWKVVVECINYSTELSDGCAVVEAGTSRLAFPHSSISRPRLGLREGKSQRFTFTASKAGGYQIVDLAGDHRRFGMWDRFEVRAHVTPSIHGAIRVPAGE